MPKFNSSCLIQATRKQGLLKLELLGSYPDLKKKKKNRKDKGKNKKQRTEVQYTAQVHDFHCGAN